MSRPTPVVLMLCLLTACVDVPTPAPTLTLTRPDAEHVRVILEPAPARARWSLQASPECGANVGPVRRGVWPDGAASLLLEGDRGDLLTVVVGNVALRDCVPPVG